MEKIGVKLKRTGDCILDFLGRNKKRESIVPGT
jgi:hypothetical protein